MIFHRLVTIIGVVAILLFIFENISSHVLSDEHRKCIEELHHEVNADKLRNMNLSHFDKVNEDLHVETWEKRMEYGTFGAAMEWQRRFYYSVANNSCINTICEIGFNAGNSALIWLMANPRARVIMFDTMTHAYSWTAMKFIRELKELNASHSDRFEIFEGDSRETVKAFHEKYPNVKCDLLSIDGGHDYDIAVADIGIDLLFIRC
jgi:hypothetical protein